MRYLCISLALALTACEGTGDLGGQPGADQGAQPGEVKAGESAAASLEPQEGSEVQGSVTLVEEDQGVQVVASLTHLEQGESYTIQVHEGTSCDAPGPVQEGQQAVIGSAEPDDQGIANVTTTSRDLDLTGRRGVVGKVVTVTRGGADAGGAAPAEGADAGGEDGGTIVGATEGAQEAGGAAGEIVACGVLVGAGEAEGEPPRGDQQQRQQPDQQPSEQERPGQL